MKQWKIVSTRRGLGWARKVILFLQDRPGQYTNLHYPFMKDCYYGKYYEFALMTVGGDITDLKNPSKSKSWLAA